MTHVPAPAPGGALVGRDRERALLHDALGAALAGRGSLLLIGGEAGIGKTALAKWLLAEATERGALALVGCCYDLSETPPYGPWAELLSAVSARDDLPVLPSALCPPGHGGEALAGLPAILGRLREYLAVLAARQPMALLLDDLHWADQASLDLLRALARQLAGLPVLLLATYRVDELARRHPLYLLLPLLVREARVTRLDLQPLGDAGLGALVRGYALPPADEQRLVAYLHQRAEGNPLFVGEMLRALEEAGALRHAGRAWALDDLGAAGVPPLLRQVIDARVDRLGEAARALLVAAAVVGQVVPLGVWAATAAVDEEGLLPTLERAVAASVLVATAEGARFAHALIREALYDDLLPVRRRAAHRRAAEALLAAPHPDPDAVADHLRRAGDPRAVAWLVRASERAEAAGALATAAERVAAAEALLRDDPAEAGRRGWLLFRLGYLARFGDLRRAIAALAEAERLAAVADAPALAVRARAERGFIHHQLGDQGAAEAALVAALAAHDRLGDEAWAAAVAAGGDVAVGGEHAALAGDSPDPALALRGQMEGRRDLLVLLLAHLGRYAEALALGEPRLPPGAATADPRELGRARHGAAAWIGNLLLGLGQAYAALGRPDEALALYRQTAHILRLGRVHLVAAGAFSAALLHVALPYRADRREERRAIAAEMVAEQHLATELGTSAAPPASLRHALDLVDGDWDAAERGASALRDAPPPPQWWPVEARATLGALARYRGAPERAWAAVRAELPAGPASEPGDTLFLPALPLQRLAAALATDAGDLAQARAWLACHDRWLAWSGAVLGRAEAALGWAACHRAAGDPDAARVAAEGALAHASDPRQPLALLAAHRLLGELATERGASADAAAHFVQALALADACAAPYERALTLLALAELRAAEHEAGGANALLAEARAILTPLSARPALERADALAGRLAAPAPAPAPPSDALPCGLSAREAEVLRLVAQGLTNAQVAERLFVTPRTVNAHLTGIYAKLGVDGRPAAIRRALDLGLR